MVVRPGRPLPNSLNDNVIEASVSEIHKRGNSYHFRLKSSLPLSMLLPRHVHERLNLSEGSTLRIALKPKYIHLFPSSR